MVLGLTYSYHKIFETISWNSQHKGVMNAVLLQNTGSSNLKCLAERTVQYVQYYCKNNTTLTALNGIQSPRHQPTRHPNWCIPRSLIHRPFYGYDSHDDFAPLTSYNAHWNDLFFYCDNFVISIIKAKIYIIGCSGGKVDICKMAYEPRWLCLVARWLAASLPGGEVTGNPLNKGYRRLVCTQADFQRPCTLAKIPCTRMEFWQIEGKFILVFEKIFCRNQKNATYLKTSAKERQFLDRLPRRKHHSTTFQRSFSVSSKRTPLFLRMLCSFASSLQFCKVSRDMAKG